MWKQVYVEIEMLSVCGFNKPHVDLFYLCYNEVVPSYRYCKKKGKKNTNNNKFLEKIKS